MGDMSSDIEIRSRKTMMRMSGNIRPMGSKIMMPT
jgi:hypothetical protein